MTATATATHGHLHFRTRWLGPDHGRIEHHDHYRYLGRHEGMHGFQDRHGREVWLHDDEIIEFTTRDGAFA